MRNKFKIEREFQTSFSFSFGVFKFNLLYKRLKQSIKPLIKRNVRLQNNKKR